MGGGNKYNVSDFNVSSKWFYNWVKDSEIVKMQPEGSTASCPTCLSEGTFTIKPFDMRDDSPKSSDALGIHIPIATVYDEYYKSNFVYAYWISYRSGVDGDASHGVSIHLAWFELWGNYGAYYDSLIYDAFGNTDSKLDSFVIKDSCYHISPSGHMRDRDIIAAESVQPVVCVDDVNPGKDVTVTVSFLDIKTPPTPVVDVVYNPTITCASNAQSITTTIDNSKFNLFHFSSIGSNGIIKASLKSSAGVGAAEAYFYDT
jgi:hypothetical protein